MKNLSFDEILVKNVTKILSFSDHSSNVWNSTLTANISFILFFTHISQNVQLHYISLCCNICMLILL